MQKNLFHIITYGCQANTSDSERITHLLEDLGYMNTSDQKRARLLILNTCSIKQTAEDKVFGRAAQISKLKKMNPKLKVILTGCMMHRGKEALAKTLPQVDIFLPIKDLWQLPQILGVDLKIKPEEYLSLDASPKSNYSALVPISYGCNNFCTYCIVPFSRGREYSRPKKEILNEVKKLAGQNYKEIWLLGQNVNSYGIIEKTVWDNKTRKQDKPKIQTGRSTFAQLIKELDKIRGGFWLRFTSPHPKDFSDETIKILAKAKHFAHYINLPLQSGDDEVLKRMNRTYNVAHYKKLVKKIRRAMPNIALSTDIIVGFPGETKKQFNNTCKIFREIKYDMAFISKYSPRPKTASAISFKDDVSWKEKTKRFEVLNKILMQGSLERNKKFENNITRVLFSNKKNGFLLGKNEQYKTIKVKADIKNPEKLIGQFAYVKIKKGLSWGLEGDLIQDAKQSS